MLHRANEVHIRFLTFFGDETRSELCRILTKCVSNFSVDFFQLRHGLFSKFPFSLTFERKIAHERQKTPFRDGEYIYLVSHNLLNARCCFPNVVV